MNLIPDKPKCRTMQKLKQIFEKQKNFGIPEKVSSYRKVNRSLIHVTNFEAGGEKNIKNEKFYCGYLPESETAMRLTKDGDFIVRRLTQDGKDFHILSYNVKGGIRHAKIMFSISYRVYYLTTHCFDSISALICFHSHKRIPVDFVGGKIFRGVKRDSWQLYHAQIDQISKLGSGAFGEVWKCYLQTSLFSIQDVAVKVSSKIDEANSEVNEKLFMEAQTMLELSHPNIVQMIGVAMYEQPLMVVLEYCPGGSIESVLHKGKATLTERYKYVVGSAKGMVYLETHKIIHRDIAARNILIGENNTPKISDFGLSIFGKDYRAKQLGKLPIRYLAPEAMKKGLFSSKSDVFAFGVFIWEVWQNAEKPWQEIEDIDKIKTLVLNGERLKNNEERVPPPFWTLCIQCWKDDPEERPDFNEIVYDLAPFDLQEEIQTTSWFKRIFPFFSK